jgi:hypothetical protein
MTGSGRRWDCGTAGAATTAVNAINTALGYPRAPAAPGSHWSGGNLAGGTAASGQFVTELLGVAKPAGSVRVPWGNATPITDRYIDETTKKKIAGIAGQSNARGYATRDPLIDISTARQWMSADTYLDTVSGEVLATKCGTANDPLDHGATGAATGTMGHAVAFARAYITAGILAGDEELMLVGGGANGTALVAIESGDSVAAWSRTGPQYVSFIARMTEALASSVAGSELQAVIWSQGERDAALSITQTAYAGALDSLIANMREDLSAPDLIFVITGLADDYTTGTASGIKAALADTPNRVANCVYVSAAGLATADGTHFTAAAYRTLGANIYTGLATLL